MLKHNLPVRKLIEAIHAAPTRLVLAITGGGSGAIGALLEVPGASRTVLEAVVPYSEGSLARWLGGPPDQACSPPTARAMAMAASAAPATTPRPSPLIPTSRPHPSSPSSLGPHPSLAGIAATASLASDRPKRGPHRVHLAAQTAEATVTWSLELVKGRRSRAEEEQLVARLVLNLIAEVCGLARGWSWTCCRKSGGKPDHRRPRRPGRSFSRAAGRWSATAASRSRRTGPRT